MEMWMLLLIGLIFFNNGRANGWIQYGDHFYYFSSEEATSFSQARGVCEDYGADLLSIVDEDEHHFITENIVAVYFMGLRTHTPCDDCDNGNSDTAACTECRSTWYWVDGQPYEYMNWENNRPDRDSQSHKCTRLSQSSGRWKNVNCDSNSPYICKSRDVCADEPCAHGSCVIVHTTRQFSCLCQQGYSGRNCSTEIDECGSNPCQNDGTCTDGLGFYNCVCPNAWTGIRCETDVNECLAEGICGERGSCVNTPGSFRCECKDGWVGTFCDQDLDECSDFAQPLFCDHGKCENSPGNYRCACSQGYTGSRCDLAITDGTTAGLIAGMVLLAAVAFVSVTLNIIGWRVFKSRTEPRSNVKTMYGADASSSDEDTNDEDDAARYEHLHMDTVQPGVVMVSPYQPTDGDECDS